MIPSLDDLVARYHTQIHAYVRIHAGAVVRRAESCSDITQEVVLKALAGRSCFDYRGEPEFRKWLIATVRSVLADRRKRFGAASRNLERTTSIDEQTIHDYRWLWTPSRYACAREELARVEIELDRMCEEHRQAITLVRLWGLGYQEAGEMMGKTPDAVRMLVNRGLARLIRQILASPPPAGRSDSVNGQQ